MWSKASYQHRLDEFKGYCEMYLSRGSSVEELAGLVVQVTRIPIVICYEFVIELYGSNPNLESSLKTCREFYGIRKG